MEKLKANMPIVIGLAIPVLLIVLIAGMIYVPRVFSKVQPQFDFIYAVGDGVDFSQNSYPLPAETYPTRNNAIPKYSYRVVGDRLTKIENPPPAKGYEKYPIVDIAPKFYRYHVQTGTSELVNFEQVAELTLDSSVRSPDSFTIERGSYGGSPFFIDSGASQKYYLKHNTYTKELELNLPIDVYYYSGQFFVGWVIK